MNRIQSLTARKVYDSRGVPTVEAELRTGDGVFRAMVPSGASTGKHEAIELRDNDKSRDLGKGVERAIYNVRAVIAGKIVGMDCTDQTAIDMEMIILDGTPNLAKLGANAVLSVSLAASRAGAAAKRMPLYRHIAEMMGGNTFVLPTPGLNVLNGGVHAGNLMPIQEFMIVPLEATSFSEAMRMSSEVYHHLKAIIKEKYGPSATAIGDEGGFAPNISAIGDALDLLVAAIKRAGYEGKIGIAIDSAASSFYKDGKYDLGFKQTKPDAHDLKTADEMLDLYKDLVARYPIVSLEDPFAEDDPASFAKITAALGTRAEIIGDDIFVTNPVRIRDGITRKLANGLLVKPNQIGTLYQTLGSVQLAKEAGWGVELSHRSGETEDPALAHIAVGVEGRYMKSGAPARSERLAKWNELLRIEEELGLEGHYAGRYFRSSTQGTVLV